MPLTRPFAGNAGYHSCLDFLIDPVDHDIRSSVPEPDPGPLEEAYRALVEKKSRES